MIAQSEEIIAAINNEETESELAASSGHGDPEFMDWTEVMFSDERKRLFRRLETIMIKQMIIKDRLDRINSARWRARAQRQRVIDERAQEVQTPSDQGPPVQIIPPPDKADMRVRQGEVSTSIRFTGQGDPVIDKTIITAGSTSDAAGHPSEEVVQSSTAS